MSDAGVIDKEDFTKSKVAMVFGQMNEPPGNRLRVALSGLTMAEKFRDEGRDILFFVDNIYRYTLAGTEVSALLGRMLPPWVISLHWPKKWAACKSVLPRPKVVRSPPSRPFTFLRTT